MSPQKREFYDDFRMRARMLNTFSKIENFIRTKYESKRWVMDGAMPDPATLDADGDDDVVGASIGRKDDKMLTLSDSLSILLRKRLNWIVPLLKELLRP